MCGICGVWAARGVGPEDVSVARRMSDLLAHRGPDGVGSWQDQHVALGHRRLAIIDLEGGRQPLTNEDGSVVVVYNGEIYDFTNLRRTLESAGHRFRTAADTEVLVHGWEEWGEDLFERLRGMFAFALWDSRTRRLVLARDRFGIKPLYYHWDPERQRIVFASEIKALFADPAVPRVLNQAALPEYLLFRTVAGEDTLFEDVRELAPGHFVALDGSGWRQTEYWTPEVREAAGETGDPIDRAERLIRDAVEARLVSDVPLGTITSGGIDSSLVSAYAADAVGPGISTFCVGFSDPDFDERPYARQVADAIHSRHHEITVEADDLDRELDRLTWAHDEPLTHPNSIPMHLIFRHAKEDQNVTVLLSGEGADEVFGGYDWYPVALRRDTLRRVPGLGGLARMFPLRRARTLARVLGREYLFHANAVSTPSVWTVLGPDIHPGDPVRHRRPLWPESRAGAGGLFIYDQRSYLPPLLQRQDRMSMAAGLEARVPFLDHPLAEWANSLPASVKLVKGRTKHLLKRTARRRLPDYIVDRRKVGFALPLRDWLAPGGVFWDRVVELGRGPIGQLLDEDRLEALADEHGAGNHDHSDVLWTLISLDAWSRAFLGPAVRAERLPGAASGRLGPGTATGR